MGSWCQSTGAGLGGRLAAVWGEGKVGGNSRYSSMFGNDKMGLKPCQSGEEMVGNAGSRERDGNGDGGWGVVFLMLSHTAWRLSRGWRRGLSARLAVMNDDE